MSGQAKHTRRTGARALTWAGLVLVPALAIVGLGSGLALSTGAGPAAPGGLLVAETRDFAAQGDAVAATAKPDQGSVDGFMDTWQNTIRVPPSPRR